MPIIIIEGGELVGKTSIVRALQDKIPYHTLVKLSGYPTEIMQNMAVRGRMMHQQYEAIVPIINYFSAHQPDRTLIFDRFVTTEKVMFEESYTRGLLQTFEEHAADAGAMQFILSAPIDVLKRRYDERCKSNSLERQTFASIYDIDRRYIGESATSKISTAVIPNDGTQTPSQIADRIIEIASIPIYTVRD